MSFKSTVSQVVSVLQSVDKKDLAANLATDLARIEVEIDNLKKTIDNLNREKQSLLSDVIKLDKKFERMIERFGFKLDPEKVEFRNGIYWIKTDPLRSDGTETPICTKCWHKEKMPVRQSFVEINNQQSFTCSVCDTTQTLNKEKANRPY